MYVPDMYGGGVERLAVWGSEGRRETPDSAWSPGEGGVAEDAHPTRQRQALRVCDAQSRHGLESVDGRRRIDRLDGSQRGAGGADARGPCWNKRQPGLLLRTGARHTQCSRCGAGSWCLACLVWSLLSICTTGHQASTGLLLGRRASTRSMFGPLLTRTHRDAPELSTKMHAGGSCQKPPPHLNARAPPSMSVSSSPQAPSSLQLGAVMAVERPDTRLRLRELVGRTVQTSCNVQSSLQPGAAAINTSQAQQNDPLDVLF